MTGCWAGELIKILHRREGIIQAICQGCVCRSGWVRDHGGSGEITTESAAEMIEIYPKHIAEDFGSAPVLLMTRLGGLEFH